MQNLGLPRENCKMFFIGIVRYESSLQNNNTLISVIYEVLSETDSKHGLTPAS